MTNNSYIIVFIFLLCVSLVGADCGQPKPSPQSTLTVKLPSIGPGDKGPRYYLEFDRIEANKGQRRSFIIYNSGVVGSGTLGHDDVIVKKIELTDNANGAYSLAITFPALLVLRPQEESPIAVTLSTDKWGETLRGQIRIVWSIKGSAREVESTIVIAHK